MASGSQTAGLTLFLPCAAQTEEFLGDEVRRILTAPDTAIQVQRGGIRIALKPDTLMNAVMRLNLHSRMAQRVLVALAQGSYRSEDDVYALASSIAWEQWFNVAKTIKVDVTAHKSPLKSLNFVALRLKDAVADRFRSLSGSRPSVDTHRPDVRIHLHLDAEHAFISLDTSGEPLFKRGWREDKGDAPLKETLAASMIAATGWDPLGSTPLPLYDPCCGSGTIVVEAAQMACGIAPGLQRRFAFEKLLGFDRQAWQTLCNEARDAQRKPLAPVFGSDIAHRMVDFAKRNAERAGVGHAVQLRGGDALQRMPPSDVPGVMLLNPPYGTRIAAAGEGGRNMQERRNVGFSARDFADGDDGGAFFQKLSAHWKSHYAGWTAWLLTPDMKLPGKLRLKESRRVPMWNGPIDCRLFRFDLTARKVQSPDGEV
ncbi:class I SAM-dependent RNA methyltransferase [Lampropedia puyangensis]|uniref:Class I SAM-dependent RNA methyltransferase n=1 Tax=Lampropedia puyangensis TaxID=1330072 RepID=A0A4S8FC93_9BURK|nr:class I SAM-dependent RNA methyltransferase [Lampropedia puyangensis]THU04621.1 class I SAM-dependent RNA methyltransferase [Lampropedia puyangensis]